MTNPNASGSSGDALDALGQLMTGTKMLADQPGVLYGLLQAKATPAQAGTIDSFMQGLDAEKIVDVSRAAGQTVNLTSDQQSMLTSMGVKYQDVLYSPLTAAKQAQKYVLDSTGGKYTAETNPDGSLKLDSSGHLIQQSVQKHHDSGGGFWGFLGDAWSAFYDHTLGPVFEGVNKAWNFISYVGGNSLDEWTGDANSGSQMAQDMRAKGYDPSSIISRIAYISSGKATDNLGNLNQKYGQDQVDAALRYSSDPKGTLAFLKDAGSYEQLAGGRKQLTPQAKALLDHYNSPDMRKLVGEIRASSVSIGDSFARDTMRVIDWIPGVNITPEGNTTTFNILAATGNLAASFVFDPTLAVAKAGQAARVSRIGFQGGNFLADSTRAAAILDHDNSVRRGWLRGIELSDQVRNATAAGDTNTALAASARFRAELPALDPIFDNFLGGEHVFSHMSPEGPVYAPAAGFHNIADAQRFITEQSGLIRLSNGMASRQASLMPGALSSFGFRRVKGAVAEWMTTRSLDRLDEAKGTVLSRAAADPEFARQAIDEGMLVKIAPKANDAIDFHTGVVLAADAPGAARLASAERGTYALSDTGVGDVQYNLRRFGNPTGEGATLTKSVAGHDLEVTPKAWGSPTAIAERARLAATRFSTLLPRNNVIDITAADSADKVYRYARFYLGRGAAQTLRTQYVLGDAGKRKTIVGALIDQVGHAAGLGHSESGQSILNSAKTELETYSAAGSDMALDGQPIAIFEGQTRHKWLLPSFQAIHQAASKVGLWEATMGRATSAAQADTLMAQWKMGALFKPSTVTRNMLEGWLRTSLDGKLGLALQARAFATARNKELWERGVGKAELDKFMAARGDVESYTSLLNAKSLTKVQRTAAQDQLAAAGKVMAAHAEHPRVQFQLANEANNTKLANQIANGSLLSGQMLGRSTLGTHLADMKAFALAGKAYRSIVGKFMDQAHFDALATMKPGDLEEFMRGYHAQILDGDLNFKNLARESTKVAKAGWGPATIRYAVGQAKEHGQGLADAEAHSDALAALGHGVRYTHQATDGTIGVERFENALAQRVDAMPETAKAAISYIENPRAHSLDDIVAALDKESKNTAYHRVTFDNPDAFPGKARLAISPEESALGKRVWAQNVVDEYVYLLTGHNGQISKDLAKYIKDNGQAPRSDWITDHLTGPDRPRSVPAPEVMAMPNGGVRSVAQSLQDIEGGAYQWLVERPLQRTTSSPVFLANYALARKALNPYVDKLVAEHGFTQEAADELASEMAVRQSWTKTEQLIDDPGQKTQFDVVARNMFPFARATNAMIRRWGTGLWQNPAAARKMMLSYEAAQHSGFIYTNEYGEPTFTYPASGVSNLLMRAVAQLPGMGNLTNFPLASDMTGGVLMSVPGADNPFRMSMGPMLSMPLRELYKNLLPTAWRGNLEQLDAAINGPIGAGDTSWLQLMPTIVRRYYQNISADDRNSALASATKGAIQYLAAAGLVPPANASQAQMQTFRNRVQAQVQNQLTIRFVFGLFAPAAPSNPTEVPLTGAGTADFAFSLEGARALSDEYKRLVNEVGGDVSKANAIFTALHPDGSVLHPDYTAAAFETPMTVGSNPGATLPATADALRWMESNKGFVGKFNNVAAYFLPEGVANEPFNAAAYKLQIEMGLRTRKTPQQFMNDIYLRHAESGYFPVVDDLNTQIAAATQSGNSYLEQQLRQQKTQFEAGYKALNPSLGQKFDSYGDARQLATQQLGNLRQMLAEHAVPDNLAPLLGAIVQNYDGYVRYAHQPGLSVQDKSLALKQFSDWIAKNVSTSPLADLFNGIFRTLDTNFQTA